MCGLVGVAGEAIFTSEIESFKSLLLLDYLRGEHSTGVLARAINRKSGAAHCVMLKAEGHPVNLFNSYPQHFDIETYNYITDTVNEKLTFLMGHNRQATIGAKTTVNAHPFRQGHIFGCHNGTVKTGLYKHITKEDRENVLKGETDSEQIFLLFSRGFTLEDLETDITGAWALTWWNSQERSLNFYRNAERTLYLAWAKTKKTVMWASEAWMLDIANRRVNDKFEKPELLATHTHVKITFNKKGEIEATETTPIKARVVVPLASPSTTSTQKYLPAKTTPSYLRSNQLPMPELEPYRENGWIKFKKNDHIAYKSLVSEGCALCSASLEEPDSAHFLDLDLVFCKTCASEWKEVA